MHLSAKKQKDLTFLEVQAQQMVNEEIDEDNDYMGGLGVKNEQRYEALLEKKKERRTVSQSNVLINDMQGESLFEFLERQVKGQMREALGQPLQNISKDLLSKVVSKEVARDLRKYKFTLGKTPNKENRKPSAERPGVSPTKRLNFGSPLPNDRSPFGRDKEAVGNSREVRDMLKELDQGVHQKVQILKMLTVKCSDADTSYKRIRQYLVKGDITQAEK